MYLALGMLSVAAAAAAVFNPYIQKNLDDHFSSYGDDYHPPHYHPCHHPLHHYHHPRQYAQWPYRQSQWGLGNSHHDSPYPTTPVYLHTDGVNRALLLTQNAPSLDYSVYSRFWKVRPLFCISQVRTSQTPAPLYAYRLNQGRGRYNHLYTTNVQEIGATRAGQTGRHGYQCLGILGYVGTRASGTSAGNMVPVYRWFSGRLQQHLFDPDPGLGSRLNQGFGPEGIMAYTVRC